MVENYQYQSQYCLSMSISVDDRSLSTLLYPVRRKRTQGWKGNTGE
jgi:hypothetical protein